MKCHYEILGLDINATEDDIKKAYRKLALQWHPDKNPEKTEESTQHFLLIQQAYEVLIDPHERAWYDKHRDAILKGGLGKGDSYQDDSVDVFPYFNVSCYKGYGDDAKGFYAIYKKVFETIAEEDERHSKDRGSDWEGAPSFGDSQSAYEKVVGPFYAYWESYCTTKSYVWVEQYDTREAPNRQIRRLMEADNKKLRDKAKKERNEQVRELASFVRKRDKRVVAYKKKLEERAEEIGKLAAQKKEKQKMERLQRMKNYEETGWTAMSSLEQDMEKLELNLAYEFGDAAQCADVQEDDQHADSDSFEDYLECLACNKVFKTDQAFANHEKSRRHKENWDALKAKLLADEAVINGTDESTDVQAENNTEQEGISEASPEPEAKTKLSKKQKKKRKQRQRATQDDNEQQSEIALEDSHTENKAVRPENAEKYITDTDVATASIKAGPKDLRDPPVLQASSKTPRKQNVSKESQLKHQKQWNAEEETLFCNVCGTDFSSRNKLFDHIKKLGHALNVEKTSATAQEEKKVRRSQKKIRK